MSTSTTPNYTHHLTPPRTREWPRLGAIWGAVSIALGLILGFTVTALGAGTTGELSLDKTVAADRFPALADLARFVDVVFGPPLAATWVAIICLALWALHSFRIAIVFGALTSVGWLSSLIGKAVVERPRPPMSVHPLVLETARDSFPSGHTSFIAAAVAATVATLWLVRRPVRLACWLGAALVVVVAATRLVLGAHYLADVVGAPLFAVGAVAIGTGLWRTGRVPGVTNR
ncbi:phosphatase PAP2 family protein [Calidifontibacter terrae]